MSFPAREYSDAQAGWLGKTCLVDPTVRLGLDQGRLVDGKSVLDIGCGNGHYSKDMIDWGASSVVGIDISPQMIDECRKKFAGERKMRFRVANIVSEDALGDDVFDVATAFFVFQFIHEKADLITAIENICKRLSRSGVLVGIVPNGIDGFRAFPESGPKLGNVVADSKIALHSHTFYERILCETGFRTLEWIDPVFSDEGRKILGDDFCRRFLNPPLDILFRATK